LRKRFRRVNWLRLEFPQLANQSTNTALASAPKTVARWLGHELEAMAPAALFFLVGFALILLMVKLFVE
jgi:hypothetical protein